MTTWKSNITFPILTSAGAATTTSVDFDDMFARKELFFKAGLWTWGLDAYGQLGNGTITSYSSPIQIGSLTTWKQISTGWSHWGAVTEQGGLWTCGYNNNGQLGLNSIATTKYSSPVQVGALTTWKQVACGYTNTAGITTGGTLWVWGGGQAGSIGNGSTGTNYSSPSQIGALTTWKQIAIGFRFMTALQTNGTLWAWGTNTSGQLGQNNTTGKSSPVQVGALTNWQSISCGYNFWSAIKMDGTLWACGYNVQGQLGNGTIAYYSSPIQIGSLTTWKQVACGYEATFAIKTDGTLWVWGRNIRGVLGQSSSSSTLYYSSPIQVGALTNWKQIIAGTQTNSSPQSNMFAIKTDGTLWACGDNSSGQLADGQTAVGAYSSPVQIGSLTNWKQVSIGSKYATTIQAVDLPD